MNYRLATDDDLDLLAAWNHELIRDEGHRNPMTPDELRARMAGWLSGDYRAVIFLDGANLVEAVPVAYALYRESATEIYLRQLFVRRDRRRAGIGRQAVMLLRDQLWPHNKRLTVEVLTANAPAVRFWRAVGFRDYSLLLEIMPDPTAPPGQGA